MLLETCPDGLAGDEPATRLRRFGPNQLEEEPPAPPWLVFLGQFRSPLIFILLLALVTVLLRVDRRIGDRGGVGAERRDRVHAGAQGRGCGAGPDAARGPPRPGGPSTAGNGRSTAATSCPAIVVLLESGVRIPADLRLVTTTALQVDESLLTGESVPVTKTTDALGVRCGAVGPVVHGLTGATVTAGRGAGVVVATGPRTELGAIAGLMRSEAVSATPLQLRMDHFAKIIGLAVGVAALVAFGSGVALGESVEDMFLVPSLWRCRRCPRVSRWR